MLKILNKLKFALFRKHLEDKPSDNIYFNVSYEPILFSRGLRTLASEREENYTIACMKATELFRHPMTRMADGSLRTGISHLPHSQSRLLKLEIAPENYEKVLHLSSYRFNGEPIELVLKDEKGKDVLILYENRRFRISSLVARVEDPWAKVSAQSS